MTELKNSRMVTGLFNGRESAERAYQAISERGYTKDDVNLVISDNTRRRYFSSGKSAQTELDNRAAEGTSIGAGVGGTLGDIAIAIAAVGTTIAIPGLGIAVVGPIAAALAGAGAGGLVGALIGYGIPEERVKRYEEGIKKGGILMGITPRSDDDARHFEQQWKNSNGEYIYH